MKARITITLKPGVLDPQGQAAHTALEHLGFKGIQGIKQGKFIEVNIAETDSHRATALVKDMCDKLLANTVIEQYHIELVPSKS